MWINKIAHMSTVFHETIKETGPVATRVSSQEFGIHGKDDTLLFPTYSNILFFIALPPGRWAGGVMRDIWYKVGTQLRYAIFLFSKDNGFRSTEHILVKIVDIFLEPLGWIQLFLTCFCFRYLLASSEYALLAR